MSTVSPASRHDLTDAQWEILRPLLPPPPGGGRPRTTDMREVLNAILYLNRSGCQWDMLPHDLPAKSTVYDHFAQWRDDGTWQTITDALRQQVEEREDDEQHGQHDRQPEQRALDAAPAAVGRHLAAEQRQLLDPGHPGVPGATLGLRGQWASAI